jgi:hypothetical protein
MAAVSNIIPLQIAPGSYRDHARRMDGFARTLDADWTEIGVGSRQAQREGRRWRESRGPEQDAAGHPASGFVAQMIAQDLGKGAHLENFGGVGRAYQRAETAPYAPRRGAGLSLTI